MNTIHINAQENERWLLGEEANSQELVAFAAHPGVQSKNLASTLVEICILLKRKRCVLCNNIVQKEWF